jgi:hypothetical protein
VGNRFLGLRVMRLRGMVVGGEWGREGEGGRRGEWGRGKEGGVGGEWGRGVRVEVVGWGSRRRRVVGASVVRKTKPRQTVPL